MLEAAVVAGAVPAVAGVEEVSAAVAVDSVAALVVGAASAAGAQVAVGE